MQGQRPRVLEWTDRAERRKVQNRLNQRAARLRKAARKATEADEEPTVARSNVPESWGAVLAILPGASGAEYERRSFADEQRRLLSSAMLSGTALDHARVLSPLLADPLLREVWWMGSNVLLPLTEYHDQRGGQDLRWTWSYVRHSLADPLLFHAQTASIALAMFMMKDNSPRVRNLALQHETQALGLLRRQIEQNPPILTDEFLWSVLLMMHKSERASIVNEGRPFGAFRPPLTNLQNIQVGSSLCFVDSQRAMVKRLVVQKGGITKITMPGLAEFFTMMDLFQASLRTEKPDYDLCASYRLCLESELPVLRRFHSEKSTALFSFPTASMEEPFQMLLWDIRSYLQMVNSHCQGRRKEEYEPPLALCRNLIQHRTLSLESDPTNPVREICRVATLLFNSVVVYPLQDMAPMQKYLSVLTELLQNEMSIDDDFRIWLLILGGMASDQMPLQQWYISELRSLAANYPKSWSSLRGLLERFLWLDVACGEGGSELWLRVLVDD